jgi:hypothetical protein
MPEAGIMDILLEGVFKSKVYNISFERRGDAGAGTTLSFVLLNVTCHVTLMHSNSFVGLSLNVSRFRVL